jgi:hypothetical protein
MTIQDPIRGRVARILNSRELVINKGHSDGVQDGMYFAVLDPNAEDITDPETGEVLGSIHRPKTFVKIVTVEERLSLARTFRQWNRGGQLSGLSGLSELLGPPRVVVESLKTSESTWEQLDEKESFVKTGDPVVQTENPSGSAG